MHYRLLQNLQTCVLGFWKVIQKVPFAFVWLVPIVLLLNGCVSVHPRKSSREVLVIPSEIKQYYEYDPITSFSEVNFLESNSRFTGKKIRLFPSETEGSESSSTNDEAGIQIDWYKPETKHPCPLILVSPIMGSNSKFVDGFAQMFAANGYHAAVVHRPKLRFDPTGDIIQAEEYLHRAVIRNRQAIDWLLKQPLVDRDRIGTFGISYGGIINSATAGVEPRIKAHVIALAGGPLGDVISGSGESSLRRYIRDTIAYHQWTEDELTKSLHETIRTDPYKLAPYVDGDDVLMIIAMRDRSVGTKNSMKLWRQLGRPDVVFVPTGHYTALLYMPYFRYRVMKFFEAKFEYKYIE